MHSHELTPAYSFLPFSALDALQLAIGEFHLAPLKFAIHQFDMDTQQAYVRLVEGITVSMFKLTQFELQMEYAILSRF